MSIASDNEFVSAPLAIRTDVLDAQLAELNGDSNEQTLLDDAGSFPRRANDGDHEEGDAPFDLQISKPRAIDISQLYALTGRSVPPTVRATLGPTRPILLCHSVTPFHRPGRRVSEVWGLGYESRVLGIDATTVGFQPMSSVHEVGQVGQEISVGLSAGGELHVPDGELALGPSLPGIRVEGVRFNFATHSEFALALSLKLQLREVQAGPVGAGGVRWNIYRQKRRLDEVQALFQSLLVPRQVQTLNLELRTWVRSNGLFGLGVKQWTSDWQPVRVDLGRT
jgi:hypothetical protein